MTTIVALHICLFLLVLSLSSHLCIALDSGGGGEEDLLSGPDDEYDNIKMPKVSFFGGFPPPTDENKWSRAVLLAKSGYVQCLIIQLLIDIC